MMRRGSSSKQINNFRIVRGIGVMTRIVSVIIIRSKKKSKEIMVLNS